MQIIEVKNNIAKISYNSVNNHLLPSDFLLIQEDSLRFIAQVVSIETTEDSVLNVANLRLSLFIDADDNLSFYNGYIIGKSARVNYISPDEIIELLCDEKNSIYLGNLFNSPNTFVKTNFSFVDDKLYIQSDKFEKTVVIVKNIASQLIANDNKVLILDFDNQYKNIENSYILKITNDFKLPLNVKALDNLIEKDIEDCPLEDRVFIQSVILELREYIQTLPDKFLQFNLFRDVIDAQYKENQIANLMALRNKLWLYAQQNLFANEKNDFSSLNKVLSENKMVVIDASEVPEKWQNFVIQVVNDIVEENAYFFVNIDGLNINKKFINDFYNCDKLIPVVSSSYSNSCRNILSLLSKNQILCKPSIIIDENVQYVDYLNRLNNDEFIAFGEATLFLPLIINIQEFDASTVETVIENDIKRDVDKLLSGSSSVPFANVDTNNIISQSEAVVDVVDETIEQSVENETVEEIIQDVQLVQENQQAQNFQEEKMIEDSIVDDELTQSDLDFLDEMLFDDQQEQKVETATIEVENQVLETDEVELIENIENVEEEEILIDETEEVASVQEGVNLENEQMFDDSADIDMIDINEQSVVEKTPALLLDEGEFTDKESDVEVQDEYIQEIDDSSEIVDVQDIDEEYIDETQEQYEVEEDFEESDEVLVEEDIEVEDIEIDENIDEKENPNLVVYETDIQQKLNKDDLPFEVGDKVYHPKHGNGIVRGFTNYSDKILFCQIEFENVGRRILDPRVAHLEKV